jgi:hypothetical protein
MDCSQSGLLDMFSNWYNFNEEKSDNTFVSLQKYSKESTKGFNEIYKKREIMNIKLD